MNVRTALYRMFDANEALLYVGISKDFGSPSLIRETGAPRNW